MKEKDSSTSLWYLSAYPELTERIEEYSFFESLFSQLKKQLPAKSSLSEINA